MNKFIPRRAIAVALLLPLSSVAVAEDDRLETIIVSGAGPERSADELISNATAIDRDEILQTLSSSLGDSLVREPGVSTTFFGQGASRPVLRGLGAERVLVLTNGIGVIDASAASPDHQVSADGIDSERIEILRGPAALAYGGQAIGGVVNVIDGLIVEDLPDEPFSGDLFGAFNSVNEGSELAARGQFTAGQLVFTLSGSMRDFDNYDIPEFAESSLLRALEEAEEEEHHDEDDDDHDEDEEHDEDGHDDEEARGTLENSFLETATLAGGVSWVGESAFFGVAVRQQTAEYGLPGHSHGHGEEHGHGDEDHEGDDDHEDEDDHDEEHEEGEEEENPFIDLEQTRIDIRGGVSINNGFLTDVIGTIAIADYEHIEFEAPGESGTLYSSEGVEARLEFDHEINGFEGAFGVQYTDKDLSAIGEEAFISPTDTKNFALFLYETREWDSGAGIEGGLRLENVERENANFGSADYSLLSGSFGVHVQNDNGWFFGGQLSITGRAPNESELFAFGPHLATEQFEVGDPTLDEEIGLNIEGTARWQSDNVGFGANLFVTNISDFIYLTPGTITEDGELIDEEDGLPVFRYTQQNADFLGGEIYGDVTLENAALGADWTFDGSVDFVQAELSDGGNVPFIPPVTFNGGLTADWGLVNVGANLTIAGDQDDPGEGRLRTDGYTTVDLKAALDVSEFGIGRDGTEIFVDARNITDEEVRYATSVLKDVAPAPGQNIRFGVRASF